MLEPRQIDDYFNASATKRKLPAEPASKHTRWVMLAKLALPGIAGILAVTLLLFPSLKKDVKEFGIDFTIGKGDIEKLNIEKTTIYMTDEKNKINNFTANQIRETEAGSQIFTLSSPEAIMPLNNDEWINIKSPEGSFSQKDSLLHLQNNVEIFYNRGMTIQTTEAFFDFKKSFGYSHRPVTGSGFVGDISAEGFTFSGQDNVLTFLGKTSITINPESLKKE